MGIRRSLPQTDQLESSTALGGRGEQIGFGSLILGLNRNGNEGLSSTERNVVNRLVSGLVEPKDFDGLTNFYLSKQSVILEKIKKRQAELGIAPENTHKEVRDSVLGKRESEAETREQLLEVRAKLEGRNLEHLKAHL